MPKPGPVRGPDRSVRFGPKARHPVSEWLTGCRCRPGTGPGWDYSVASMGAVGAKLSSTPTSRDPLPAKLPTRMHNTKRDTANTHVAFSRKFVVRWTPPIWLAPWNPVASPPPLGILDQNHCPQQEADNQNDDGKESGHVQFFKSYAAFSAGPQNKHFFPGISKRAACKLSSRGPFGLAGRRVSPWFPSPNSGPPPSPASPTPRS